MKKSLSNVRFAIKTTSVTLPSITGRYRCTTQAERDSEFRECFRRCHKFTMRSVWMNEWIKVGKAGFELSGEWMKRWKGGAGLFTHLINKYESPRKHSTKVKSALCPVRPFNGEKLWPMTWPVDTMGVPAWSRLLHLKPLKFFPHFIRRLCHSWHIIQRRRRPVGKPVRQKSPLGRLIFLVIIIMVSLVLATQCI